MGRLDLIVGPYGMRYLRATGCLLTHGAHCPVSQLPPDYDTRVFWYGLQYVANARPHLRRHVHQYCIYMQSSEVLNLARAPVPEDAMVRAFT